MMPSFHVNKIRGYTSISIINRYSLQQATSRLQGLTTLVYIKEGCNMHQITL